MRSLAAHYGRCRVDHPSDDLLVLFDIDGTILDMRNMVQHVLAAYDKAHGTDLFRGLQPEDIDVHENHVDKLLQRLITSTTLRREVHDWYLQHRWEPEAVLEAHRPFRGVMEVIRWFQLQPHTFVGLNTGRPEALRTATLRSLNELGREYRVTFADDLLAMNPGDWADDVTSPKVRALATFADAGYRVVAMVDNEPANIDALAAADPSGEILFLHAQTLYESQRIPTPHTVRGNDYDIRSLIDEDALPRHVQFVWHGVNDKANLRQFLGSSVHWGEIDVRYSQGEFLVQHDPVDVGVRSSLQVPDVLDAFQRAGKGIKLDIKERQAVGPLLETLGRSDLGTDGEGLWLNGRIDLLGEDTFRYLAAAYPEATLQCGIDFLAPLLVGNPAETKLILAALSGWGINRFSVSWANPHVREVLDRLDEWGYELNIYAVPDLEQFLRAALLLPRSITADFNFPEWHYFGRGSGQSGRYHQYTMNGIAVPGADVA